MVKTEKLELIIELVLWSGYLEHERPLSLLLIAKPESGKSELVLKYQNNKGVIVLTDATAWGIQRYFLKEMEAGLIHHIIIPDLITPLSRQPSTVSTFIVFFNNLIEEGIVQVRTYAINIDVPKLNVGLIATITPDFLRDSRRRWARMGFLSRMIPVAYCYSEDTAMEILLSITNQEYHKEQEKVLPFPDKKVDVKLPRYFAIQMLPYTKQFVNRVEEAKRLYGFRYQRQLQVLLKAHALMHERNEVTQDDVDSVRELVRLFGTEEVTL